MKPQTTLLLRPSVINAGEWWPERPSKTEWNRLRKQVLERDDYTCAGCGHRALKWMNVHHIDASGNHTLDNLGTICVACHAVLHMGRNLSLGVIEIWESNRSQVEVVQLTRQGIYNGKSLQEIKESFDLKEGEWPPSSIDWANNLLRSMGNAVRGYLDEPLVAVFVNFQKWQLDDAG